MFKNIYDFAQFDNIILTEDNIKKVTQRLKIDRQIQLLEIFKECVIVFREEDGSHYIYYKQLDEQIIHLESYDYRKGKLEFIGSFDIDPNKDGNILIDKATNIKKGIRLIKVPKDQVLYYIKYVASRYMGVIGYLYLIQKDKKVVIREGSVVPQPTKKINSKPQAHQYRNIIMLDNIEVTIKTTNPDLLNILRKNYNRFTESWGVRGHYRTLKSGKKVFIKAYTKGNKDKYKPKNYELA